MIKNLLFIATASVLFTGCFFGGDQEEVWTSYIYPDKENTKRSLIAPVKFPSFETCQKSSQAFLKEKDLENVGTFKCGKNCEYHEGMKLDICQEWK